MDLHTLGQYTKCKIVVYKDWPPHVLDTLLKYNNILTRLELLVLWLKD